MNKCKKGKEEYREIIDYYFRSFGTGDFLKVQFSSEIVYIWPMFDPKAIIDNPEGLLQWLTGNGY